MRRAPELEPTVAHLLQLRDRFRSQLIGMSDHLEWLADNLEERHRDAARDRLSGSAAIGRDPAECEMQEEHDELAMELAHVRLALEGVELEIASRRRLHLAGNESTPPDRSRPNRFVA